MSDAFWMGLFTLLILIAKEFLDSYRSRKMANDINTIEKATNSMKDALIVATEKEALGRGKLEGAAEERSNPTPSHKKPWTGE